jgi:hypothetical protein
VKDRRWRNLVQRFKFVGSNSYVCQAGKGGTAQKLVQKHGVSCAMSGISWHPPSPNVPSCFSRHAFGSEDQREVGSVCNLGGSSHHQDWASGTIFTRSVADLRIETFAKHPDEFGGGREGADGAKLGSIRESIGKTGLLLF